MCRPIPVQSLVSDGQSTTTYAYDSFDQLVRENNQAAGKTWTYAYDDGGNIQSKTEYAYTTGTLGAAVRTIAYGYGDASWSDLLTSIGGQSLTADEIGNLLSDGTWTYTWQHGRQLAGMSKTGTNIAYGYDSDGRRITKTVNDTTYNYHYLGDQLVELTWGGNKLHFTYDSTGPLSVNYNGTEYFYVKNAQGDVTGLVSASGTRVVTYTYDAWGNPLATTLGAQNPLRYRGYVYDTETGLYYLQSRYYNPAWGRFINADAYASTGQGIIGNNMFAYCGNNPVICADYCGESLSIAGILLVGIAATISYWITKTVISKRFQRVWKGAVGAAVGCIKKGISAVKNALSTIEGRIYRSTQAPTAAASDDEKVEEKVVPKRPTPVIFPLNPNDFNPAGLIKVPRQGTKNGMLISWMDPLTNKEVFRWDENPNDSNGPHYHIYGTGHFIPGVDLVPEPYATIYFPVR